MRIFLSGPMGAGKSTTALRLAQALGLPALDLDAQIELRGGATVTAIFRDRGEAAFRQLEREVLGQILARSDDFVLALGGGTVVDRASRARLLEDGLVVTLQASLDELYRRVGAGTERPLLARGPDVATRLGELLHQRAAAYAECHLCWHTEQEEALLPAIVACLASPPILVPLGERSYRVRVGAGLLASMEPPADASGVLVVSDDNVHGLWAAEVVRRLEDAGCRVAQVVLPAGEAHKTLAQVEAIWQQALDARLDRDAFVWAIGGGVVTDMAAFAASTLMRGVRVGLAPTSLLAMVDAAVGGKTGFDMRQGKNLVGTFWQPTEVVADLRTLSTLPVLERQSGLAEVVKSAWLDSEQAVVALERDADALAAGDLAALESAVRRSVALKARIVSQDEREAGSRALLNLGHTLGHGFEAAAGLGALGHGQAVALGMLAACRVERALGEGERDTEHRLAHLLQRLGLPTNWEERLDAHVLSFLDVDKKRRGGRTRFILPGSPGHARVHPIEASALGQALRSPGGA